MALLYNKHKNNLSLPGFRKGKVPRKLIEAQYGEGFFYEDAINHIFPDEYMAAVKELGLDVVSLPLWILIIFSPARAQNSSAM